MILINKKKCTLVYLLIVVLLHTGCISYLEGRSNKIVKHYGKCNQCIDTVIVIGKWKYVYKDDKLTEAGKNSDRQKRGYWFYYDKNLNLTGVTKYKNDTSSKVILIRNTGW